METIVRTCPSCDTTLVATQFNKSQAVCKNCSRERSRVWRQNNQERIAAYYPKQVEAIERYRKANLHKANARLKAARAGLKKDHCENCGETLDLHMHHEDYSKPLEVITLCRSCHEEMHHKVDPIDI